MWRPEFTRRRRGAAAPADRGVRRRIARGAGARLSRPAEADGPTGRSTTASSATICSTALGACDRRQGRARRVYVAPLAADRRRHARAAARRRPDRGARPRRHRWSAREPSALGFTAIALDGGRAADRGHATASPTRPRARPAATPSSTGPIRARRGARALLGLPVARAGSGRLQPVLRQLGGDAVPAPRAAPASHRPASSAPQAAERDRRRLRRLLRRLVRQRPPDLPARPHPRAAGLRAGRGHDGGRQDQRGPAGQFRAAAAARVAADRQLIRPLRRPRAGSSLSPEGVGMDRQSEGALIGELEAPVALRAFGSGWYSGFFGIAARDLRPRAGAGAALSGLARQPRARGGARVQRVPADGPRRHPRRLCAGDHQPDAPAQQGARLHRACDRDGARRCSAARTRRRARSSDWGIFFGLDFFVLNMVLTGLMFAPLERVIPHRADQRLFRIEWREDLFYFLISSMLVQAITFLTFAPSTFILDQTGNFAIGPRRGREPAVWLAGDRGDDPHRLRAILVPPRCSTACRSCGASMRSITAPRRWTGSPARGCTSSRSRCCAA